MGWVDGDDHHGVRVDDIGQSTRPMEKNSRCKSYTPFQRLLCGKLFSFIQVLVVHLMSWLAHLAEPMLCLFLRAALLGRTIWPAAIESDSLTAQRWLNCNDISCAHQLRFMSFIARERARRHRAWLHISRIARQGDDTSSTASISASAGGAILAGQDRRSGAA